MNVGKAVDLICKEVPDLKYALDTDKLEETKLRVMWDDTLIEIEQMDLKIG